MRNRSGGFKLSPLHLEGDRLPAVGTVTLDGAVAAQRGEHAKRIPGADRAMDATRCPDAKR